VAGDGDGHSACDRLVSVGHGPDDYQQGATVKIMFIHVPNAWLSMFVWGVMSVASLGTLVWRHPLADVAAKSAAPIGAAFTFLALVTGSLWGRPMWGTYWEWDARLTSVLILFLMYLGLIALWRAVEDPSRAARAAAVLTWSAPSIFRSSSSRSIGGIRCISRRR
jgi:heme exporter protein C